MIDQAAFYFILFLFYSFLGWAYETTLCSVRQHTFINRGFLNGPLCPVYGCGAMLVILTLSDISNNVVALFLSGVLLTTALEYITSYFMEKLFHARWWDYSQRPFNINGRVCLLGAVVFGVMSVLVVRFVDPAIERLFAKIPPMWLWVVSGLGLVLFCTDLAVTVTHLLRLNARLAEIQKAMDAYKEELRGKIEQRLEEREEQIRETLFERFEQSRYHSQRIRELIKGSFQDRRLLRAFPQLHSEHSHEALEHVRRKLREEHRRRKEARAHSESKDN